MPKVVEDFDLEMAVQAYYDNTGNKSEAARSLGLKRRTYLDRLKLAEKRFGLVLGKVADGKLAATEAKMMKLPKKGHVARYLLTSIQNNTHIHPGFNNLLALNEYFNDLPKGTCELMVGTYSYQLAAYGKKAVKRGTFDRLKVNEELWYATEAKDFIVDESVELAPGLVWCGEQNILPTAQHPLTGFDDYNGRKSNIVPHAKIEMLSTASMADEPTKYNFSTGTMTMMNYIQKRVGIMAEQKHSYGAALVEVDSTGNWWVRQLELGPNDEIMDVGPDGVSGVKAHMGLVTEEEVVEGIYCGDMHAAEMDVWVRDVTWGKGGLLDTVRPAYQFLGDVFSMRYRSPHELKNAMATYQKYVEGEDKVEDEVDLTRDAINGATRTFCETIIVPANHDRHLERWLSETDWRDDPPNARYYLHLNEKRLEAVDEGNRDFNILEYALRRSGLDKDVRFLSMDESFVVLDVENGLHGDLGANGSRGSTKGLAKLGRKVNKGHDHTAAIWGGVYSAGACAQRFPYMMGPSSHSVSHILTYKNGRRAIITLWSNRWRA